MSDGLRILEETMLATIWRAVAPTGFATDFDGDSRLAPIGQGAHDAGDPGSRCPSFGIRKALFGVSSGNHGGIKFLPTE